MPGKESVGYAGGRGVVRVAVCGDAGTGKSSLIIAAATDTFNSGSSFDANFSQGQVEGTQPPVLPPTRIPSDVLPGSIPVTVADTSSSYEWRADLEKELDKSDVVVLCYKSGCGKSLGRIGTYWLPELRRTNLTGDKPVLLVGCQEDVVVSSSSAVASSQGQDPTSPLSSPGRGDAVRGNENRLVEASKAEDAMLDAEALESKLALLIDEWKEIEVCLQCSAKRLSNCAEVFVQAQKAVMHPTGPLYDAQTGQLKPRCVRALKRIFQICDEDADGFLSDRELNHFQATCFGTPLQPEELEGVRKIISTKVPEGIAPSGVTLKGFVYLHALFVARGRMDTTWTVLRKFGYDNALELRPDLCQGALSQLGHFHPDQCVEITDSGRDFLRLKFRQHDKDADGVLSDAELEELFSTAPGFPGPEWHRDAYHGMVDTSGRGGGKSKGGEPCLTLDGFLSLWDLMALRSPATALVHALYLGRSKEDLPTFLRISRRRKQEVRRARRPQGIASGSGHHKPPLTRRVLSCVVFATPDQLRRNETVLTEPDQQTRVFRVPAGQGDAASSEKTLVVRQVEAGSGDDGAGGYTDAALLQSVDLCVICFGQKRDDLADQVALMKRVERKGTGLLPFALACVSASADEGSSGMADAITQQLSMAKPLDPSSEAASETLARLCALCSDPHASIPRTEERLAKEHRDLVVRRCTTGLVVGAGVISALLIAHRLYASASNVEGAEDESRE